MHTIKNSDNQLPGLQNNCSVGSGLERMLDEHSMNLKVKGDEQI